MEAATNQDESALRARLAQARERLDGLVRDLHAIDGELERLGPARKQHRLLHLACGALEELSELGASALFWGEPGSATEAGEHLRHVRGRVDAFDKRLAEIEDRRNAVLEEIDGQQEHTELLEYDLEELERLEEQRKLEWTIEREVSVLPARNVVMPWTRGGEDDQRYRRTLAAAILASLLLGLLIPLVDLPLPEPSEPIDVPERLTRLIQEARPLPPPVLKETTPERIPPPEEEPLVAETPPPKPTHEPGEGPAKGPGKGLLAFREKFSGIKEVPAARLGSQARISSAAEASGQQTRSLVTSQAPGSSGGVNLASLSRDVGGTGGSGKFEGVQVARATSTIGGGGSGRGSGSGSRNAPAPGRTDEEIQIVFDRYKSALYRLYNRELRNDPTLKGQMVLRLRIEPDGSVSLCELQASDMRAPQLAAQVVDRVRTFDFGAKAVPAITILYPIDFLPAT